MIDVVNHVHMYVFVVTAVGGSLALLGLACPSICEAELFVLCLLLFITPSHPHPRATYYYYVGMLVLVVHTLVMSHPATYPSFLPSFLPSLECLSAYVCMYV